MVHLHVVGLGDVDDAELVAEKPRDMHLRVRGRGDGNAVLAADLARFHVAGIAAAQQHDRVVLAAGAGLAHQRQAVVADRHEFLLGGDRPVAVGRVNALMPGLILGEQGTRIRDKFDNLPPEQRAALLNGYPGGRAGTGDEVAAAVGFLLSESAGFISGVALPVDGAYR